MNPRFGYSVILPIILCMLIIPLQTLGQEDVATALYEEGLRKYILEDYTGALEDFESALKLQPGSEKIRKMYLNTLIKQGNAEYEAGNLKGAEGYFLRAYRLSGEDAELKANLESIRTQLNQMESREKPVIKAEGERETRGEKVQEVQLPFDLDAFVQQQNEENRRLLEQMVETQREERETLFRSMERNQQILDESFEAQQKERETLFRSMERNQQILDENFEAQQEERENFLLNIEENRTILDRNIEAQRQERETLFRRIEESQRLINESMHAQREERDKLLESMMEISRAQREDRRLFSRTLMILVGGSILIALIIFFGFVMLLRKRTVPSGQAVYYEPPTALDIKPKTLLEYAGTIDETKYLADERYNDVVRAKRLRDLYKELQQGEATWEGIQEYLNELDYEVKADILDMVEKKIRSGEAPNDRNVVDILLPFITDGDQSIGARSRHLIAGLTGRKIPSTAPEVPGEAADALSYDVLLQFARMADAKTGRLDHSVRVADMAHRMALALNDPYLDPEETRRVGLVHDIGYLELDDRLLRKEGKLTERQFSIIKTHTECGLHLLQHVDLPQIFTDGIKYHHERLDGSGYPEGLKGKSIPKIARLLAIADFFDAVTSARPHRPALTIGSGIRMMENLVNELFDPELFRILFDQYKERLDAEQ